MNKKNYHTHTERCHHAYGSEEEYILAAIKAGYKELGFSDHTPWHYDSHYVSHMRMKECELEGYVQTLQLLKEKYKSQISIKIGLECEYFPKYMEWLKYTINKYQLDYVILGNHFDESDEDGIYFGHPLTKEQFTKYIDNTIAAMKTKLFSYLAHPDLANYPTDDPYYLEQMYKLCKYAKEYHCPLEFNLLGYETHRQYPNETFFKIASEVGNEVIIGVDAHESQALMNNDLYDKAYNYLKSLNIKIIEDIHFITKE